MQELIVLKYDSYHNAIAWLDKNPGMAVEGEDSLFSLPNSAPCLNIIFSSLMSEADKLMVLEWFPNAKDVNNIRLGLGYAPLEHPHSMYILHNWTRNQVIEVLKKLGAVVKKSPCCMEIMTNNEIFSRLEEMEIRLGKPLSQADPNELGDLYRKLYPG
ncbi:MAG: hypothetical protein KME52_11865 [Desmonostoc geniculatum HA4340-LM1]|jgi:hypothetical protein|nr:hypothetical protein [Desmonostoc geniculatum HA4340-LM1]